jgi:hypothetical protein
MHPHGTISRQAQFRAALPEPANVGEHAASSPLRVLLTKFCYWRDGRGREFRDSHPSYEGQIKSRSLQGFPLGHATAPRFPSGRRNGMRNSDSVNPPETS